MAKTHFASNRFERHYREQEKLTIDFVLLLDGLSYFRNFHQLMTCINWRGAHLYKSPALLGDVTASLLYRYPPAFYVSARFDTPKSPTVSGSPL